jgi:nicotinamide-nucleotide amidase
MRARRKLRIATAESCTGGLIAALLTEIPGSSDAFDRGFVVYSNRAKSDLLGVPGDLIADAGAVSEAVARSMAEGAVENSNAHLAVSVTGVAGPGGGTKLKPIGLVHIAAAREGRSIIHEAHRFGDIGRSRNPHEGGRSRTSASTPTCFDIFFAFARVSNARVMRAITPQRCFCDQREHRLLNSNEIENSTRQPSPSGTKCQWFSRWRKTPWVCTTSTLQAPGSSVTRLV